MQALVIARDPVEELAELREKEAELRKVDPDAADEIVQDIEELLPSIQLEKELLKLIENWPQ